MGNVLAERPKLESVPLSMSAFLELGARTGSWEIDNISPGQKQNISLDQKQIFLLAKKVLTRPKYFCQLKGFSADQISLGRLKRTQASIFFDQCFDHSSHCWSLFISTSMNCTERTQYYKARASNSRRVYWSSKKLAPQNTSTTMLEEVAMALIYAHRGKPTSNKLRDLLS